MTTNTNGGCKGEENLYRGVVVVIAVLSTFCVLISDNKMLYQLLCYGLASWVGLLGSSVNSHLYDILTLKHCEIF